MKTVFALRFTAPATAGAKGSTRLGYQLSLAGPSEPGCPVSRALPSPEPRKDQAVAIRLVPDRLGGSWCSGVYTARVSEVQTPVCKPGSVCPQYIRMVGIVGHVSFRVRRGG